MATEEQTTRTNPLLREGYRKAEEEPPPQNTPHNSTPKNSGGIHGVTNEPESHESAEAQEVCSPTKPTGNTYKDDISAVSNPMKDVQTTVTIQPAYHHNESGPSVFPHREDSLYSGEDTRQSAIPPAIRRAPHMDATPTHVLEQHLTQPAPLVDAQVPNIFSSESVLHLDPEVESVAGTETEGSIRALPQQPSEARLPIHMGKSSPLRGTPLERGPTAPKDLSVKPSSLPTMAEALPPETTAIPKSNGADMGSAEATSPGSPVKAAQILKQVEESGAPSIQTRTIKEDRPNTQVGSSKVAERPVGGAVPSETHCEAGANKNIADAEIHQPSNARSSSPPPPTQHNDTHRIEDTIDVHVHFSSSVSDSGSSNLDEPTLDDLSISDDCLVAPSAAQGSPKEAPRVSNSENAATWEDYLNSPDPASSSQTQVKSPTHNVPDIHTEPLSGNAGSYQKGDQGVSESLARNSKPSVETPAEQQTCQTQPISKTERENDIVIQPDHASANATPDQRTDVCNPRPERGGIAGSAESAREEPFISPEHDPIFERSDPQPHEQVRLEQVQANQSLLHEHVPSTQDAQKTPASGPAAPISLLQALESQHRRHNVDIPLVLVSESDSTNDVDTDSVTETGRQQIAESLADETVAGTVPPTPMVKTAPHASRPIIEAGISDDPASPTVAGTVPVTPLVQTQLSGHIPSDTAGDPSTCRLPVASIVSMKATDLSLTTGSIDDSESNSSLNPPPPTAVPTQIQNFGPVDSVFIADDTSSSAPVQVHAALSPPTRVSHSMLGDEDSLGHHPFSETSSEYIDSLPVTTESSSTKSQVTQVRISQQDLASHGPRYRATVDVPPISVALPNSTTSLRGMENDDPPPPRFLASSKFPVCGTPAHDPELTSNLSQKSSSLGFDKGPGQANVGNDVQSAKALSDDTGSQANPQVLLHGDLKDGVAGSFPSGVLDGDKAEVNDIGSDISVPTMQGEPIGITSPYQEKSETRVPMIESNTQDPVDRQEDRPTLTDLRTEAHVRPETPASQKYPNLIRDGSHVVDTVEDDAGMADAGQGERIPFPRDLRRERRESRLSIDVERRAPDLVESIHVDATADPGVSPRLEPVTPVSAKVVEATILGDSAKHPVSEPTTLFAAPGPEMVGLDSQALKTDGGSHHDSPRAPIKIGVAPSGASAEDRLASPVQRDAAFMVPDSKHQETHSDAAGQRSNTIHLPYPPPSPTSVDYASSMMSPPHISNPTLPKEHYCLPQGSTDAGVKWSERNPPAFAPNGTDETDIDAVSQTEGVNTNSSIAPSTPRSDLGTSATISDIGDDTRSDISNASKIVAPPASPRDTSSEYFRLNSPREVWKLEKPVTPLATGILLTITPGKAMDLGLQDSISQGGVPTERFAQRPLTEEYTPLRESTRTLVAPMNDDRKESTVSLSNDEQLDDVTIPPMESLADGDAKSLASIAISAPVSIQCSERMDTAIEGVVAEPPVEGKSQLSADAGSEDNDTTPKPTATSLFELTEESKASDNTDDCVSAISSPVSSAYATATPQYEEDDLEPLQIPASDAPSIEPPVSGQSQSKSIQTPPATELVPSSTSSPKHYAALQPPTRVRFESTASRFPQLPGGWREARRDSGLTFELVEGEISSPTSEKSSKLGRCIIM